MRARLAFHSHVSKASQLPRVAVWCSFSLSTPREMDRPKKLYDCNGGDSVLFDTSFACEQSPSGVQETDTRTPIRTQTFRARIRQTLQQNPDSVHFELSFTPPLNSPSLKRTSSAHPTPTEDNSSSNQKENVERNIALHSSPLFSRPSPHTAIFPPSHASTPHTPHVHAPESSSNHKTRKLSLHPTPRPRLTSPLIPTTPLRILDFSCSDGLEEVRFPVLSRTFNFLNRPLINPSPILLPSLLSSGEDRIRPGKRENAHLLRSVKCRRPGRRWRNDAFRRGPPPFLAP